MIYEYLCETCGKITEEMKPVAERNESPFCEHCGSNTKLAVSKCSFELCGADYPGQDYKIARANAKYIRENNRK
jgi:putative FmdB family regulatory protein